MNEFVGQDIYQPDVYINKNTILADGAIGYDRSTGKFKIGDGTTVWSLLDFVVGELVDGSINSSPDAVVSIDAIIHIDGGRADSIYTAEQVISGGNANG